MAGLDGLPAALDLNPDALHFIVLANEFEAAGVVDHRNLADRFNGVAVVVKEHVAAAGLLSLRGAEAPLFNGILLGDVLEARIAVDINLLIGGERQEEFLRLHGFLHEGAQLLLINFAVGEGIGLREVLEGALLVVRDHHAARAHRGVAAALGELFENDDGSAGIMRGNCGSRTGAAVAENDDVGLAVPFGFTEALCTRRSGNERSRSSQNRTAKE